MKVASEEVENTDCELPTYFLEINTGKMVKHTHTHSPRSYLNVSPLLHQEVVEYEKKQCVLRV